VALLIAGLGVHGLVLFSVAQRRRELVIRLALGSTAIGVIRLLTARLSALVLAGVAIGVVITVWSNQLVAPLLYGVDARDLATMIGAFLALGAVALVGACVPVWQAGRMDPAQALRSG
jgi:ABC-type antimicrobial peptide transport system permease subunit